MAELRYYARACPECSRRGKPRYHAGGAKTETLHCVQGFTGQRAGAQQNDLGMYWYNSRWYDQLTGRFLQPDTIVPQPGNPQALNRYSYVLNNALRYTAPPTIGWCIIDPENQTTSQAGWPGVSARRWKLEPMSPRN
ncbi:MAG: hypothetical protein K1X65_20120 [Caldilineales bacterium]|nr:hypothetical protein [Caldilineales bacterium]